MRALEQKVIVITGAGYGLGRAYALDVSTRGGTVVVSDIDGAAGEAVAAEIVDGGGTATAVRCDVSKHDDAATLIRTALERHGRIDGLVNNAGLRPEGPAWEEDPNEVRRAVEVNFLGSLYCGIPALKAFREQGSGAVVNISSRAHRGIPHSATYAATKGAIASLTYSWAIDMKPFGVRVNATAPQAGNTGTRRRLSPPKPGEPTPEQMAPLVSYLLSDRAEHITGQVVRLGGPGDSLRLGLMRHPGNGTLLRRDEGWSFEAVQDAFDTVFASQLETVGPDGMVTAYRHLASGTVLQETIESL